jgi:hypothetical protein
MISLSNKFFKAGLLLCLFYCIAKNYKKVSKILHFVLAYRNKTCYIVSIHKNKEVIESYEQK